MIDKVEYLSKKDFKDAICAYKLAIAQGRPGRRELNVVGKMFLLLAQNLLNKANFVKYSPERKEEMVSNAVFNMLNYGLRNYNVSKNPFSYFTRIAYNTYKVYCKNRKKYDLRHLSLDMLENGAVVQPTE